MAEHRIFPHGLPERLSDGVWLVAGGLQFPLRRNMIVLQLPSGELLLHSVVALGEDGLKALEALGKPAYVIVPSVAHQLDSRFYHQRFPELKFVTPAFARDEVAKRVPVFAIAEEFLPPLGFVLHTVTGTRIAEYAYEWPLPSGGRMLMLNDLLGGGHFEDRTSRMGRLLIRHMGPPNGRLDISRIFRLTQTTDAKAIRRLAGELAKIPDLRLITVSHGDPVTNDAAGALRAVASDLPRGA